MEEGQWVEERWRDTTYKDIAERGCNETAGDAINTTAAVPLKTESLLKGIKPLRQISF